jgi:hypothetical protein
MIHIYCENCEGWDSFPIGESHHCSTADVYQPMPFIGGDDWFRDDSDY